MRLFRRSMIYNRTMDKLFNVSRWALEQENRIDCIHSEIDEMDGNRLLNTPVDDLVSYFEKKYRINVPILNEEQIVVSHREKTFDVYQDRVNHQNRSSTSIQKIGTIVEMTVPFTGDPDVFMIRPSSFTPSSPRGRIVANAISFEVEGIDLLPEKVKAIIDQNLGAIRKYLECLRYDVGEFNDRLCRIARIRIDSRQTKLLADRNLLASLGYNIRMRSDAHNTYITPNVQRRLIPTMPPASSSPFVPEPAISDTDYENILSIINNMALVMERSPSAFKSIDEESLRFHILVQLNGHYEGQATGETFNHEGKTDVLIRTNGKNVFIAECKFWSGPKKLIETIDQLLGYLSWRDTKSAIILFNRNKNISQVLNAIPKTVMSHKNFKKKIPNNGNGRPQFIFRHKDDANRELILTVLVFDVPNEN